jgi:hypothetical protein
MKKIFNIIILLTVCSFAYPQNTITGVFPALNNQYIKLVGFEGFNTYTIDSVKANDKGYFELSFDKKDYGMGYLAAEDNKAFIVILAPNENLRLQGEALAFPQTIKIISGEQNQRAPPP